MYLVVDTGNSSSKLGVWKSHKLVHTEVVPQPDVGYMQALARTWGGIEAAIRASVVQDTPSWAAVDAYLADTCGHYLKLDAHTPLPIGNAYATPERLGLDRIAAAVGAWARCPGRHLLVMDAGSALTVDWVSEGGVFEGGNISPGLQMRFRALHEFTSRLPLYGPGMPSEGMGRSTEDAIRLGVQQGMLFEMQQYVESWSKRYANLTVLLTGGDGIRFVKKLKNTIFAPYLVGEGLYTILQHNIALGGAHP